MNLPEDMAEYQQLIEKRLVIIDEQRATIKRLEGKVMALEAGLNQKSRNSLGPLSSNGYCKLT